MADETGGAEAEIGAIEQTMRSDYGAYQSNPGMQEQYMRLLEQRAAGAAPPSSGNQHTGPVPRADQSKPPTLAEAAPAASSNVTSHSMEDARANFEAEPELAELLADWGPNAEANLQTASEAAARILNGMSPQASSALWKATEELPAADFASLMHQLAGTRGAR